MADRSLASSYKQYKAGTTKVASWLANAARGCQDVTVIIPSLREANNAAKRSKQKKNHATAASLDTTVTVTTSQLLNLAKVVVQASISIPEDIIRTIQAVIAGRSIYAEWYTSCTALTDISHAEQKNSHRYFIDVLKEIQRLLENSAGAQAHHKRSKQSAPLSKDAKGVETISNVFSKPQFHEPLENALGSAPALVSQSSNSKVHFELEEPEDDTNFAIWCLLQDLRDLRLEVRNLWMEYRDGKITFGAVTEMTANAVSMAQYAEGQLFKQYPDVLGYLSILRTLGLEVVSLGPNTWLCAARDAGRTDVSKGRVCGSTALDLLCPQAFLIISAFID